jgi:hypothetical protein
VDVFSPSLSSSLVVASNPLSGLTGTLLWESAHFDAVQLSEYTTEDRYDRFVKLDPQRVLMPSIDAVCASMPILAKDDVLTHARGFDHSTSAYDAI